MDIALGPRLHKLNSDTLELIQAYESVDHVVSENTYMKSSSVHRAILGKYVYEGYRWIFVER